jgi:hypothetical protein
MRKPDPVEIPTALQFNPRIWWDPVPWWFINELDKSVLTQLATVQLQMQKDVLAAQVKSIDASLKIIGQAQRG